MQPSQRSSNGEARTWGTTPAERAAEFTAVQRRLKEEAAVRRKASLASPNQRHATGLSQQTGRRRTP
jgi:hypothetical protein